MDFSGSWRSKSSSFLFKYTSLIKPSAASQRELHQRHQNITNYEPVSPVVTCMGRIKRCKMPPSLPPSLPPLPSCCHGFHLFSVSQASSYNQYNQNTTKSVCACSTADSFFGGCCLSICKAKRETLKVEEMDPPLPVERRKVKLCFVESLWKRRCRGKGDLAELVLCRQARLPVIEPAANFGILA